MGQSSSDCEDILEDSLGKIVLLDWSKNIVENEVTGEWYVSPIVQVLYTILKCAAHDILCLY